MKISFNLIAHKNQRYPTAGDYWENHGMFFRVSKMKDRRYCWLVFLHEIVEWAICRLTGVTIGEVTRFDRAYERARRSNAARTPCDCAFQDEPGADRHAPYRAAHQTAEACERIIATALEVDWKKYCETIKKL